jgi:site-specific recombinase XerD
VGRRDFAILVLLARLGLRAGEVAALRLTDVDWRAGELVIRGKGRREERLPLPVDAGEAIVAYLRDGRPAVREPGLFLAAQAPSRCLTTSGISSAVASACLRAGLPVAGPHRLRHSAATQMLQSGATLGEVGQVLRQRGLATTSIYAKVDRAALSTLALPWPGSRP